MSGFQSFTEYGLQQFSSDVGGRVVTAGAEFAIGAGGFSFVGFGDAFWAKLNSNTAASIQNTNPSKPSLAVDYGYGRFKKSNIIGQNIPSGYLDVFAENGVLNWSDAAMASVPDVQGVLNFTKSEILNGSGAKAIPSDCWISMSFAVVTFTAISEIGFRLLADGAGKYYFKAVWAGSSQSIVANAMPANIKVPYARVK